jgi:hypothetical protein
MKALRREIPQRVGVLFVLALTLVPLALSGHFHTAADQGTLDACAGCVVRHDSRATSPSPAPVTAPVFDSFAVVVCIAAAPPCISRPLRNGRAPPLPFTGIA